MKLSSGTRADLFGYGSQLTGMLGAPFQNPMDLTLEDIEAEIALAKQTKLNEMVRFDRYLEKLEMIKASILANT